MSARQPRSLITSATRKRSGRESRVGGRKRPSERPCCVGIFGIGLIGGSIADRLRSQAPGLRILGSDRAEVLAQARRAKLIDSVAKSESQILCEADIVVLSATPSANKKILESLSRLDVDSTALVIDTGSTQTSISALAERLEWRNDATFIAGHPMAGSESAGLANRSAELFVDHPFFFDLSKKLSQSEREKLDWLTGALGSYPLFVESARHDQIMTDISHLPQLVSTVIGSFVRGYDKETLELAGTGLQSMIRLGGSQYPIWRDVFAENKSNLLERFDSLIGELQAAREEIASGSGVSRRFKQARRSYQCLW